MRAAESLDLKQFIRTIPDFPKPGIQFRDITPLLAAPTAFRTAIARLAEAFAGERVQAIVAAEARGFILAAPLALELNASFVPVRKPGKLPFDVHTFDYDLEYGSDTLQMHVDGLRAGERVLIVDDLLATGGTVVACRNLVEKTGATIVGCGFLVELCDLGGAQRLAPLPVVSLVRYD